MKNHLNNIEDETMKDRTIEKKLESLDLSMPNWKDFIVEQYRKDPEYGQRRVISEDAHRGIPCSDE